MSGVPVAPFYKPSGVPPPDLFPIRPKLGIMTAWLVQPFLETLRSLFGPSPGRLAVSRIGCSRRVVAIQSKTSTGPARWRSRMRQSDNSFHVMIDAIPTMAWCSPPDGSVEFLNQRWHDYTGLS